MSRLSILFSLLGLMATGSSSGADIIYRIDPVSLSNRSISGFIQTDGTLGNHTSDNITDFQVNGVVSATDACAIVSIFGTLTATPAGLFVYDTPGDDIASKLQLYLVNCHVDLEGIGGRYWDGVSWVASASGPSSFPLTVVSHQTICDLDVDWCDEYSSFRVDEPAGIPVSLRIASVPEPSGLCLALVGLGFAARKKLLNSNKN